MTSLQLVVDCADPHALADWWAETLGWTVEPTKEEFIEAMVAEGRATRADTRTYRGRLVWATGQAINQPHAPAGSACPRILFQLVSESKTVKNRAHLDIHLTPGVDLDTARDALLAGLREGAEIPLQGSGLFSGRRRLSSAADEPGEKGSAAAGKSRTE